MPAVACLILASALAAMLPTGGALPVGALPGGAASTHRPGEPDTQAIAPASDFRPARSRCRIYFGCPPMVRGTAGIVQQR
jgi:hypothetical protein